MKTPDSVEDEPLVGYLRRWIGDRGALANLRCALRPALRQRAWPLLAPWIPLTERNGHENGMLRTVETVAGLWASKPELHRKEGNFGATCRRLRGDHGSFDLRFRRLLDCEDRDELCERIIPIALAAQAKAISIDYEQLLKDLRYFAGAGREGVRIRWAQAYWGTPAEPAEVSEPTITTSEP